MLLKSTIIIALACEIFQILALNIKNLLIAFTNFGGCAGNQHNSRSKICVSYRTMSILTKYKRKITERYSTNMSNKNFTKNQASSKYNSSNQSNFKRRYVRTVSNECG